MRVGIYGGSFNPIHNGHLGMAKEILNLGIVDRILFVVSPQNPFKRCQEDELNTLWDDRLRLRLTQIAVENVPGIEVSDVEFQMPRPSYMVDTLAKLQDENPNDTLVLIIGMDNWERFDHWYKADEILEKYEIWVLPRETSPLPTNLHEEVTSGKFKNKVTFAQVPLINMSSTWIRQQISENPQYNGEGLPEGVWREIQLFNSSIIN